MFTKRMKVDSYIIQADNILSTVKKFLKKNIYFRMNENKYTIFYINVFIKLTKINNDHLIIDIWNEDITGVILSKNKSLYNKFLINGCIEELFKYIKKETKIVKLTKTNTTIECPNKFVSFLFTVLIFINGILLFILLYNLLK